MVLELSGTGKNFKEGVAYLERQGVKVQNAAQEVKRNIKKCPHCGACTAVCPTGALFLQYPEMSVIFDVKRFSVCELCFPACPTRAMNVRPAANALFA